MEDIVVCADHSVTRAGISIMSKMTTTRIVAQLSSLQALEVWLQTQRADLAVIALSTLGTPASETIFQLLEGLPREDTLSVLLLLGNGAEATAQANIASLVATGAVSIVPIDISTDQLRCAILATINGFNVLHPSITEVLFAGNDAFGLAEVHSPIDPLTPREIQVLNQLASGLSNKAIAKALLISEHTVKFHISAILAKFHVSSRTEAVSVGIRAGLVTL